MTKAAICTDCLDIVSPYWDWRTNRAWRWCHCEHMGVRWRDGAHGLIEVTARRGKQGVRVLGLNNDFLIRAIVDPPADGRGWRELHRITAVEAHEHHLFYAGNRACWALIVRPGESGDVIFVDFDPAHQLPLAQPDRAPRS